MWRRAFIAGVLGAPLLAAASTRAAAPRISVAKSPSCGCCGRWIEHMRAAGFEVAAQDVSDEALSALKRRIGLAPEHTSCHTARVDGYFIEGHVPAADVQRLLRERPEARGLAVPGMPAGSPGMEVGGLSEPYETLLIDRSGRATVFARH